MATPEHHDALESARRINEIPWSTALAALGATLLVPTVLVTAFTLIALSAGWWPAEPLSGGAR